MHDTSYEEIAIVTMSGGPHLLIIDLICRNSELDLNSHYNSKR